MTNSQSFRSLCSRASRISFSTQLVTVRASASAARFIRSVMPAGRRNPIRSGLALLVSVGVTTRFFLVDNVCTPLVQRTHAVCQTANPVQRTNP